MTSSWHPVFVGGGGFISGMDIAADGTKIIRSDGVGAYKFVGSAWSNIVTTGSGGSMPSSIAFQSQGLGTYEIRIAPSNTQRLYMIFQGYVLISSDQGASWIQTAFTRDTTADANDGTARGFSAKLAIDPVNADVCIATTPTNGPYITTNAGTTWTALTGITAASPSANGYLVAFDPSSTVTGGKTQGIYLSSYGTGVYHSTNGGSSWTLTTSTPTTHSSMCCSADGYLYLTSYQNFNILNIFHGSWSTGNVGAASGNYLTAVTADPSTTGRLVVLDGDGRISVSTDHGVTWTGKTPWTLTSTDIPWITYTNGGSSSPGLFGSSLAFDPTVSNKIYTGTGLGTAYGNPPSTQVNMAWTDISAGQETLSSNWILKPPSGNIIMACWDQGVFVSSDPTVYPSVKFTTNNSLGLQAGWAIDFSPSTPTTIVGLVNWSSNDTSGYSLDGGVTWSLFATTPPTFANTTKGGCIAVNAGASLGTTNIVIVATDQGAATNIPCYTIDGGANWLNCSFPGSVPTSGNTGWGSAYFFNHKSVCSDRVTAGTFYAYNTTSGAGVFKSTDSGATWTQTYNGASFTGASAAFARIDAVPNNAGHLFLSLGKQNDLNTPAGSLLWYSTNAGTTWVSLPNVADIWAFGWGKAQAGGYPAMYIVAYVSGIWGIWRSDNANVGTPTWTQIGDFPLGLFTTFTSITGDLDVYGKAYITLGGGWAYYGADGADAIPILGFSVITDSGQRRTRMIGY